MKTSKFQFSQPRILKMSYCENGVFRSDCETVNMPIELRPTVYLDESDTKADVELELRIGEDSELTPFLISVTMGAKFHWKKGDFSEKEIDRLLKQNAVSLLLSYARPIVAMVTSQSKFPTYDLPYLDLRNDK